MGGETPKQYLDLNGACALRLSVEAFLPMPQVTSICVVINPDDQSLCTAALEGLEDPRLLPPVAGGDTRASSVRQGLTALGAVAPDDVLIHDAARPFVPASVISDVMTMLADVPGACAGLPVIDALWSSDGDKADTPVPRDGLWRAQTPQGFHYAAIRAAHDSYAGEATDDVAVARQAGLTVRFVQGSEANYKITTIADLARARADAAQLGNTAQN